MVNVRHHPEPEGHKPLTHAHQGPQTPGHEASRRTGRPRDGRPDPAGDGDARGHPAEDTSPARSATAPRIRRAWSGPGRIERFSRPFDRTTDVAALQAAAYRDLKTGDWGVRYYLPVPGKRPEAIIVRVSNEIQTQGDKVPFSAQVEQIAKRMDPDACVVAIFWDCQTARDSRKRGSWTEQVTRPGFERALDETVAGQQRGLWVHHSSRIVRSLYGASRLEEVNTLTGVLPRSATDQITVQMLGVTATVNSTEWRTTRDRTLTGRETTATAYGIPPAGKPAHGWVRTGSRARADRKIEHDAAVQAVWTPMLTGLRYQGWTYTDAAVFVTERRLPHQRRTDTDWHSGQVARLLSRDNYWTGVAAVHFPGFDLATNQPSPREEDRQEVLCHVPPATLIDPETGERPVTPADLAYIRAHAATSPGPGSPRGTHARPLSGLVRCAVCGMTMSAKQRPTRWAVYRRQPDGTTRKYPVTLKNPPWYFVCPGAGAQRRGGRGRCERRPLRLAEAALEADVWGAIATRLRDSALITAEARSALDAARRDPEAVALEAADAELSALADEEILWLERADAGRVSAQAAERKLGRIAARRRELERIREDAAGRLLELAEREQAYRELSAAAERVDWGRLGETLAAVAPEDRPVAIRAMAQGVEVQADGGLVLRMRWAGVVAVSQLGVGPRIGDLLRRFITLERRGQSPILAGTFTLAAASGASSGARSACRPQ